MSGAVAGAVTLVGVKAADEPVSVTRGRGLPPCLVRAPRVRPPSSIGQVVSGSSHVPGTCELPVEASFT